MDSLGRAWDAIPEAVRDPVALAIPVFATLLVLEAIAAVALEEEENRPGKGA